MAVNKNLRLNTKAQRPWLTAACERLLVRISATGAKSASSPLATIPRRLLVVKVFGIGDSILIRSIIEHLRERHPEMQIGVMVGPPTREIMTLGAQFKVHQYTQRTLTLRSAFQSLIGIRRCHYDAILNFEQRSIAGTAFLAAAGAASHLGFLPIRETPKALFLTHAVRFRDELSMWQSFIRLARLVDSNLPATLPVVPLRCGPTAERRVSDWWKAHVGTRPHSAIALHLGSQDLEFRRWPLRRFVEFAERARACAKDISVILTGTAPERPLIHSFIEKYSGHAVDASKMDSLEHTAALLTRCSLLVSNDTGIMHLGAAMATPTVGLFGPNSPRYWAPVGPRATYVYDTKLSCSPCLNLYADRWPLTCSHPEKGRCMLDIEVDSVMAAARRVIAGDWLN
jgi:ADP-heptose:LPS heptosyltransferase